MNATSPRQKEAKLKDHVYALQAKLEIAKAENRALREITKWQRLLCERGVHVLVCDAEFISADVTGDHGTYRVDLYRDDAGREVRECSCPNAEFHPIHPTCHHLKAVEAVWKFEPRDQQHAAKA